MTEARISIDLGQQTLELETGDGERRRYRVSTSKYGPGEQEGSHRTPRGRHSIRAKIGAGCPVGAVFVGRRPTGEIYSDALAKAHPERDTHADPLAVGRRARCQPAR